MEPPPPYSALDGGLQQIRNQGVILERRITRAVGIAESLKDWDKVILEKKEKGISIIECWKDLSIELIQKQCESLIKEVNETTEREKNQLKERLSKMEEDINSALYLNESIENVIKHRQEHDVESTKMRLEEFLKKFEVYNSPQTWKPALTTWRVNKTAESTVNNVKLVTRPAERSEFRSLREISVAVPSLPKREPGGLIQEQTYVFQYSFQTKTYNDKARCHPQSFATHLMDVVVPDENNKIVKVFTMGGQLKKTISHPRLQVPGGLCITKLGKIAVIDSGAKDIKFFTTDGTLVGISPTLPGPTSIACNSKNQLVIADMAFKAVYTLTENGSETVSTIQYYTAPSPTDPSKSLEYPYFRTPHYVCVTQSDQIVVSDRAAGTVLMFESDGTYIDTFGQGDSLSDPYGVSFDPCGSVLVAENTSGSVSIVDRYPKKILTKNQHDIASPTMAIVTEDESILVGEYLSGLIKVFAPASVHPSASAPPADREPPPPAYDDVFGLPVLMSSGGADFPSFPVENSGGVPAVEGSDVWNPMPPTSSTMAHTPGSPGGWQEWTL